MTRIYFWLAFTAICFVPQSGFCSVLDSLKSGANLGKLMERTYRSGCTSCGCGYNITIYNYEHSGDGVFIASLPSSDSSATTIEGRMYTLRGDARDNDATVYQFIDFKNKCEPLNFRYLGNRIELLDESFRLKKQSLTLHLVKK